MAHRFLSLSHLTASGAFPCVLSWMYDYAKGREGGGGGRGGEVTKVEGLTLPLRTFGKKECGRTTHNQRILERVESGEEAESRTGWC